LLPILNTSPLWIVAITAMRFPFTRYRSARLPLCSTGV
jgi:hypothetical protein